jgi:hypothetical protein
MWQRNKTSRTPSEQISKPKPQSSTDVNCHWAWSDFFGLCAYFVFVFVCASVFFPQVLGSKNAILPSCMAAFSHSTLANYLSIKELRRGFNAQGPVTPGAAFAFANSCAFFFVDTIYLLLNPIEGYITYILHHVCATLIMAFTIYAGMCLSGNP